MAAACGVGFLSLALLLPTKDRLAFDIRVAAFVEGLPVPLTVWALITMLGGGVLVAVDVAVVAVLLARREVAMAVVFAAIVGAGVLVVLIGCSRVALGVHYPSEVVGGWLGGIAVLALVVAITAGRSRVPGIRGAAEGP